MFLLCFTYHNTHRVLLNALIKVTTYVVAYLQHALLDINVV